MSKCRRLLSLMFLLFGVLQLGAQEESIIIMTTVEYLDLLDGSESRLYITTPDGRTEEVPLRGLYSFGGYISEKKINSNDSVVAKRLTELQKKGWSILTATASTQPKTETGKPPCILTRYVLIKRGQN
ncbi:MAG: hypothetical protein NZM43_09430 [Saprospiraceae bacterium]|nr:hypothetical protein [Saprospiraceae bacterium]MDW8484536.1 hypothetical protein [Saprospiraceae bacterium]